MSWDSFFFYLNCKRPQVIIHDIGYILYPSIEHFHNIPISLFSLSFKFPRYYKLFCLAKQAHDVEMTSYRRWHDADTWHRCQQVVLSTLCSRWDNFIRANLFFAVSRPTASESICRCKGTSEGYDLAPLVTCSEGILTNWTYSRSLYKALFALS